MEKTRTMNTARISLLTFLALALAVSCSKFEEDVAPVDPKQPAAWSPTRSYDEALSLAQQSIALVDKGKTRSARSRRIVSRRGQCVTMPTTRGGQSLTDTLMYVFNFEDNDGFSVIAANRAVDPVLAVTEKGNYTYGEPTGVENFDFYMDLMAQSLIGRKPLPIDTLHTMPMFKTVEVNESRSCEPLVPVEWHQGDIFGAYCSNEKSGCVATAIAQIMAYYRFPTSITTTYTDAPHAGETIALNWDWMIDYSYGYEIAALMREIGQRVGMIYHPVDKNDKKTGSGAKSIRVPNCMISFGFKCNAGVTDYAIYPIWDALDELRPVYVDGYDYQKDEGHAWVADGYKYSRIGTDYYEQRLIDDGIRKYYAYMLYDSTVKTTNLVHYNWGWLFGWCNGYFAPVGNVTPGNGNAFSNMHIITSIRVNK